MPCTSFSLFRIEGVIANVPEMLLSKGSDAPLALRALFRQCVAMAPSILVLDPLTTLTARNPSRQIDLSPMDEAFLLELDRILEEAKENGVTMIGVTIEKSWVQDRILRLFDEQVSLSFDWLMGRSSSACPVSAIALCFSVISSNSSSNSTHRSNRKPGKHVSSNSWRYRALPSRGAISTRASNPQ